MRDSRVQLHKMPLIAMYRGLSLLLLILTTGVYSQTQSEAPARATEQQNSIVNDAVQGGWTVPMNEENNLLFDALGNSRAADAKIQLDNFRSERNAALARNKGNIPQQDRTELGGLANELNTAAPMSFEAHMANYYVQYPAPAAFQELDLAAEKGKEREELIGPKLGDAARKNNTVELNQWALAMKNRGRVAPGLYRYAEDLMSSLEPEAVLFAAGDMDAYPLWVEQFANSKRKDVLVVDERLLVDPGYRARTWANAKATGTVPPANMFIASLVSATERPVFLSLALGEAALAPMRDKLYVTGIAMRLSNAGIDNISLLEERWGRFKKAMDAGPLSRNYLVPGSVLLKHYRTIGDEARASRLEHELRGMAKQLGATNSLIKTGVLAH